MLKTFVLLNTFVEAVIIFFSGFFDEFDISKEPQLYEIQIFCNIIDVFSVIFEQFLAQ